MSPFSDSEGAEQVHDIGLWEQVGRVLFEEHPQPVLLVEPGSLRLLGANGPAARLYGYSPEQLARLTLSALESGPGAQLGGERLPESSRPVAVQHVAADGRELDLRVASREVEAGGRRVLLLVVHEEPEVTEQGGETGEDRYRLVTRATNDVVWDWDIRTGQVHGAGTLAKAFGYPASPVENAVDWWMDRVHPDDRARVRDSLQSALDQGAETWSAEYRFQRLDGSFATVQDRAFLRRDGAGRPLRMVGSMQDVTEQRIAEAELRALFAAMSDVVLVIGADGRYLKVAPTNVDLLFLPPDELVGRTFHDILPAAQAESFLAAVRAVVEQRQTREIEYCMEIGGEAIWFSAAISPMGDDTVLWVARDITERKRSEQALRESEERFRQLAESIRQVFWIADARTGSVLYVSPAYREVWGCDPDRLLQEPETALESVHPEDRERLRAARARLLSRGQGAHEYRILHPEMGQRWIREQAFPVRNEEGEVIRLAGIAEDVTERKQAEEMRARFTEMLEATPDYVEIADAEGRVVYRNPAAYRLLGVPENEQNGSFGMLDPDLRPEWAQRLFREEAMPAAIRDGVWSGASVLLSRGGGEVPVWQVLIAHRAADGNVDHFSTIARDLTDREQLEEQLRQAQKLEAVGKLAGGIAHDFNNMLLVITGFASLLQAEIGTEGDAGRYLEEIQRAAERSAGLTRQLLAFSRKQILRPKVVNINEIIRNLEGMLRRLIGEDVALLIDCDPRLQPTHADPGQIEQVIVNLAVNARDAMPQGGRLRIETRNCEMSADDARDFHFDVDPGSYVCIRVQDTGHGMDEATLQQVFDPFFTTKNVGEGTGLGLSTVYGIVKQSGGYIWAESEVGQGSTFVILLPGFSAPAAGEEAAPETTDASSGSETILVAEDEPLVRGLLVRVLQKAGYRVLAARHGAEALALEEAYQGAVDLALVDVVMPEMSGRELADHLLERRPGVRLLFMSGYTDDRVLRYGISQDRVPFLEKPVRPERLLARVREVLDQKD